ncbi:F-box domain protein [Dictyocaulus viviparus]|uniref:F-box domain protein n=1 Tax=Dictyocaulus viviparus TaxID=29172 RepID=A0A0D8XVA1_DICVI|nr:F-box domain protein [Dictyocaulus viviparus]
MIDIFKSFLAILDFISVNCLQLQQFPKSVLAYIFAFLDCKSLLNCELTCKKWSTVIEENLHKLPKLQTDQIRILFDEAEILIHPIDEKKCPVRYSMPSLQGLERRLHHLTTQSLFIRGLISVESVPVLRLLLSLTLRPQQVYIIWSQFSPASIPMLEKFFYVNREFVVDVGLEECSPPHLFNDSLLDSLLPGLTCLRLWNNGKSGNYAISDCSIYKLANAIADGYAVETIDLTSCSLSESSLSSLILAWSSCPLSDLCISLNYCPLLNKHSLYEILALHRIFLRDAYNKDLLCEVCRRIPKRECSYTTMLREQTRA